MRRAAWLWPLVVLDIGFCAYPVGATPLRLDIDTAVDRALVVSRTKLQKARVEIAQASLERSKALLPANPFLSGGAQHTTQTGLGPNYVFLLSQEFEIAGQRKKRIEVATQGIERATWEAKSAEQSLSAAVKMAFVQALVNADRVSLARQKVYAVSDLANQLQKQKLASDTQRFGLNLAQIQKTRARRELAAAEQVRERALGTLRRLLGLPVDQALELTGAPERHRTELPPGPELLARALEHRADLLALRHGLQQADRQIELTKREAIPNITVSGTVSRFEGDTLAGGDIGMQIPIFQRKAADTSDAVSERTRFDSEVQVLERQIAQEVTEARRACIGAITDLLALQQDILPKSEENLELEWRLYRRGEATAPELIGVQVDLLTARRDYLDAVQAYNEALIELERVTGLDLKLL